MSNCHTDINIGKSLTVWGWNTLCVVLSLEHFTTQVTAISFWFTLAPANDAESFNGHG